MLRPGGVLLLDEPSSSLDGETEQILLQRLSERLQDKTTTAGPYPAHDPNVAEKGFHPLYRPLMIPALR